MDLRKVKTLIDLVETSGIAELEIQEGEERVRITRATPPVAQPLMFHPTPQMAIPAPAVAVPSVERPAPAAEEGHAVKSPMVGTFYRSASPGAAPFVEIGDTVAQGDTLCIVEAMKLMNEVAAGEGGRVAEIVVENGEPVEFEQVLMYLEPADE